MFDRNLLQEYLDENGIKQKTISTKSGIDESALSKILTGKRKCEVNEYIAICKALKVKPDKFIRQERG